MIVIVGPTKAYLLKVIHDHGAEGDSSPETVARDMRKALPDVERLIASLIDSGHVQLVGGHLAVHASGMAVIDRDNEHNPISAHEQAIGLRSAS